MPRRVAYFVTFCLLMTAVRPGSGGASPVKAKTEQDVHILDNGTLVVRYDARTGTLTARRGERVFITEGRLVERGEADAAETRIGDVRDALGTGKAIEVTWPDGRGRRLALYESMPLVCFTASLHNAKNEPVTIKQMTPLVARVDLGLPVSDLKGFGPEGPYQLGEKTQFCFAAAVDPKTRAGVVCGWLSHYRASGVVATRVDGSLLTFEGQSQYGRLLVPPGATAQGETLAIGYFDDALEGLETYADGCARAHEVKLPDKVPSGYCTWYHARASDQEKTAELAEFAGRELKPFGFDFVQIDDGWQIGSRDFTAHHPAGRYSDGMKPTCEKITGNGLIAGIWLIPFGWNPKCAALADHADWFVKRPDGSIYSVRWAGSCLDMTHPEARKFLREVVARITRDWGYKYIKIDGLWSGMAVKILYPSPAYREDELGTAVLHDPGKTQVEAYRSGLQLVREAAGDDVFILGCNIAQNARTLGGSFGLVDGMRIGHDIGARWGSIRGCAVPTSHFYFFHNKVWFNDPDCLMLRDPLTLDQARAWGSLLAISGQMNVVSEWLPGLPADKLDVIKRTMPNHGGLGRPIDLFENNLPTIWHYQGRLGSERMDVVGLFNWDESRPARLEVDLARLGLPSQTGDRYVGFDYWENEFVAPFSGKRSFELRPSSCRVIAIGRLQPHPQLVGTSRHVTQGAIDVQEIRWDPDNNALRGRSNVVGNDPYELRIVAPRVGGERFTAVDIRLTAEDGEAGVSAKLKQDGPQVRVTIQSPKCRPVGWTITFQRAAD